MQSIQLQRRQMRAACIHMLSPQDVLPRQTWHDRNLLYKFVRIVCENIMCGYLQMCNTTRFSIHLLSFLKHRFLNPTIWTKTKFHIRTIFCQLSNVENRSFNEFLFSLKSNNFHKHALQRTLNQTQCV